jgi:hypothetical protein
MAWMIRITNAAGPTPWLPADTIRVYDRTQGGKQLCSFPHSHLLITLDPDLLETAGPTAPSVVDQSSRGTSSAPFP